MTYCMYTMMVSTTLLLCTTLMPSLSPKEGAEVKSLGAVEETMTQVGREAPTEETEEINRAVVAGRKNVDDTAREIEIETETDTGIVQAIAIAKKEKHGDAVIRVIVIRGEFSTSFELRIKNFQLRERERI